MQIVCKEKFSSAAKLLKQNFLQGKRYLWNVKIELFWTIEGT